jgi:hypothetical protein
MAVTVSFGGSTPTLVKGPYQVGRSAGTPMRLYRVAPLLSGTYVTGGFNIDLTSAFAALRGGGAPTVTILWARAFGDYYDGTLAASIDNASLGIASMVVSVKLFSGTNGSGGSEISNGAPLSGPVGLLFAATYDPGLGAQ